MKRQSDSEQVSRLERELERMDAAGLTSDTERQMHELLADQLHLLRRISARLEGAVQRRDRVMEMLDALWQEMEKLVAHPSKPSSDPQAELDRIEILCEEAMCFEL